MKKVISLPVIAALFLLALTLFYYQGSYVPTPVGKEKAEVIQVPQPPISDYAEAPQKGEGAILLDYSHDNNFATWELDVLLSRLAARGFSFEQLRKEREAKDQLRNLESKLAYAKAFMVVAPRDPFSRDELEIVKGFVRKNGRLLLIADPTRRLTVAWDPSRGSEINSVSAEFGIIFANDFIYNLEDNEGNFRNVFVSSFEDSEVTQGLNRVTFYTASSLFAPQGAIAFADAETRSSARETNQKLAVMALTEGGRVLAASDLSFMAQPLNASQDNNRLVANIADFLTKGERIYYLSDFPHFFRRDMRVVYASSSLLERASKLKNLLVKAFKAPELTEFKPAVYDMLYLGLYSDAKAVEYHLTRAGITIDDKIGIMTMGKLEKKGTALLSLDQEGDRHVMTILADSEDTLKEAVDMVEKGELNLSLVNPTIGLFRTKAASSTSTGF